MLSKLQTIFSHGALSLYQTDGNFEGMFCSDLPSESSLSIESSSWDQGQVNKCTFEIAFVMEKSLNVTASFKDPSSNEYLSV